MRTAAVMLASLVLCVSAAGATKPHVISFGKAITVKSPVGAAETEAVELRIRPLYVDGRLREYSTGATHEVTDRLFVVQRAFRLNDSLRDEPPRWIWQRGGWLVVDRVSGRISALNLPDFDPNSSAASWYRDYVAYCGRSDDGQKFYAMVAQLGRRKPVLKTVARDGPRGELGCAAPTWHRQPTRVTFEADEGRKLTYDVIGHAVDLAKDSEGEEPDSE